VVKNPPLRSDNDLRGSDRARQDATRTIVQETHHVLRESREFKQCVLVSHSRDSQQRHCALRTRCIRQLELRRSWQPRRNFLFNLRPSRRDEGHFLSKYSGRPNRSFWTHLLMLWRVKRFIGRFQPRGTAVQAVYRFHCSTPIRLYTVYTSRIWARDSELPRAGLPEENLPKLIFGSCHLDFLGDCSRPQPIAIPATLAQVAVVPRQLRSCCIARSVGLTAVFAHPTDATTKYPGSPRRGNC